MQETVAPQIGQDRDSVSRRRAQRSRSIRIPQKDVTVVRTERDTEIFHPIPGIEKQADLLFVGRTRTARRASARCSRRSRCCPST
ncbi:MAG: hypothetical protein R3E53_14220 [Myxococcota bacterium]